MIKHITIHLTNACNLNCEYCHVDAKLGIRDKVDIDSQIIENIFSPALESVSVAGGEPFVVKPKLYQLLDILYGKVDDIAVTTNGLLLDDEDFEKLKSKHVRLQFSVDGVQLKHEINRGTNTYTRTMNNLIKAIECGIRVDVLTTVTSENAPSIPTYLESIDDLGIENITLLHFTPKGRGEFVPENEIKKYKWIEFCYSLREKLGKMKTRVWIQPRFMTLEQIEQISKTRSVHKCNWYRFEYAYVDINNGKVYPCGLAFNTPLCIGDIRNMNIQELANRALSGHFVPYECRHCKYTDSCGGGARCYAWLFDKDIKKKDPHCTMDSFLPICPFPALYIAGPKMKTKMPTIV